MITFFYEVARKSKSLNRPYWKLLYKVNKVMVNLLYPISQRCNKAYGLDEKSRIIVSLTTYPARISTVWITIASLLTQTMKPYKVILWLAKEQFTDCKIPDSLEKMKQRGLEIRFCGDLKPHKKYYYAMQEYPNYYIITADDDTFYPENHIERLWDGHEKYPGNIICQWSHQIGFMEQGEFRTYNEWADNAEEYPSYLTLAVGCGGVLYPPGCLPEEAFDAQKITKYALCADDLWLKCMEILKGWKAVNCNQTTMTYFNIVSTMKSGLWTHNTGQSRNNDMVWKRLMELYPEVKEKLLKENDHEQISL